MRVRVLVRPKQGILDPQGQAVERALPALGFEGVRNVHIGRLIELDVEDPAQLPEMCEQLLANPLIEDYEIVEDVAAHVERALPALGFTGVSNVHIGRLIELDVEDPARLPEMCDALLANPLIEDYEIVERVSS